MRGKLADLFEEVPGGGTAVTALQTAQQTDDAPTG